MMKKFARVCVLIYLIAFVSCRQLNEPEIIHVSAIEMDVKALSMTVGDEVAINVTITPNNAHDKSISWSSNNPTVVSVREGVVSALTVGNATIIAATVDGGKKASCQVTVSPRVILVQDLTLNKNDVSMIAGETVTLTATVSPSDATDKTVIWKTSDASVATVKDGVVTAVKVGTATITAQAGDQTATCTVSVKENGGVGAGIGDWESGGDYSGSVS